MTLITTSFIEKLSFNDKELMPAIAQDWLDGAVLMMAWVSRKSLELTLETGEIHYWSRSRKEIWHKGATSGHIQKLKGIRYDCDSDVILFTVEQIGDISCHLGTRSCFTNEVQIESKEEFFSHLPPADTCSELFHTIEKRHSHPEEGSYTNNLLSAGDNKILKKIGGESAEFVMACKDNDPKSISGEAADIIFHLQVALKYHGVTWKEVLKVLSNRKGKRRISS